jgi:integrase
MRHTYASHAIENGASEDEVRRQLGHTTTNMTKKYVELADRHRRERHRRERHRSYSPYARHLGDSNAMKKRGRPAREKF